MDEQSPLSDMDLEEAFRLSPEFGIQAIHEKCHALLLRYIRNLGLGLDWTGMKLKTCTRKP